MKLYAKKRKRRDINITSLIDVLFILLIFVMVTSTFIEQQGLKLDLPGAKSSISEPAKENIVFIDSTKKIYLNDKLVDKNDVSKLIKGIMEKSNDKALTLKADKTVPHGDVVFIMDAAKLNGVERLTVATKKSGN